MEQLPGSTAHSRTMSYEENGSHHHSMGGSVLARSASANFFHADGRANDFSGVDDMKAVVSGVLAKKGQDKHCLLLGAYFMYGEAPKKTGSSASLSAMDGAGALQKQICLSDVTASFESATHTIRLIKMKGHDARRVGSGGEKVFVARTEAEFYVWQAAITRAMVLWPGKNAPDSAGGRPPVNADSSALGFMLREMLRMWALLTFSTNVDVLTAKDITAGVNCLRTSSARPRPRLHRHGHRSDAETLGDTGELSETVSLADHELNSNTRLSKEAYNSVLVNTLAQLPYILPDALKSFISILMDQRKKAMDSPGVSELLDELSPKLLHVGHKFVSVALEYRFDVATGLWPTDIDPMAGNSEPSSPHCSTFDCVELFRTWMARSPTGPWSAVLVITEKYLAPRLRDLLGMSTPPRSDPAMPGLNGLRNLGNTCYLNSVLQCMMHTPHLVRFFLMKTQRLYVGSDTRHDYLSTQLGDLYTRMYTGGSTLVASEVANFLVDYDDVAFKKGDQHDAHEALVTIFDVLDSELSENGCGSASPTSSPLLDKKKKRTGFRGRVSGALAPPPEVLPDYVSDTLSEDELVSHWRAAYVRAHNSFVTHYFSGQTVQKITCPHCNASSFCCDSFTYLIAPITQGQPDSAKSGSKSKVEAVRLEECLEETFKAETLDMGDTAKCDKCKETLQETRRTLELQRLPPYLIICLNRFEVDDHGKASAKRDVPVLVPEQLSLGPWLRRAATLPILGEGGNVHLSQMDHSTKRRGGYELIAAVMHTGSINSGHYAAACKVGSAWYEYSDGSVNRLAKYSIWAEDSAKDMYLLFYRSTAGDP